MHNPVDEAPAPTNEAPPVAASTAANAAALPDGAGSDTAASAISPTVSSVVSATVSQVVSESSRPPAVRFELGDRVLVPSGGKARTLANIAAIELVQQLENENRSATTDEQHTLARWSGWGAVPQVFDPRNEAFSSERQHLQTLLSTPEYREAEASILNAHYTSPIMAKTIWQALDAAGFSGGRVLEPGCGSGNFIGHAPKNAVMVGVELDPMTSRVAAALYPDAQIRNEGFQTTRVPENSFVAAVGNVPFGNFAVYDPAHNADRHSIHNYFILKSLALTAPGGYVAVITSRYTLDSTDTKAREAIAAQADLIGALRLPSDAFKEVAGTDVVTDILLLRKREEGSVFDPKPAWVDTRSVDVLRIDRPTDDLNEPWWVPISVNGYFLDHPERVLGELRVGHGMHGRQDLQVIADTEHWSMREVSEPLTEIVTRAREHGFGLTATADSVTDVGPQGFDAGRITAAVLAATEIPLDTLRYNADASRIERWQGHTWAPHTTAKTKIPETRRLIELRDIASQLITAQRDGRPAAERDQLRELLNQRYDNYVATHGPINRFTLVVPKEPTLAKHDERVAKAEAKWRAKQGDDRGPYRGPVPANLREKWDEDGWNTPDPYKRRAHLDGGIRDDPGWAIISALENFDERTQTVRKPALFATDVLTPARPREHADTVHEAVAIALEEHSSRVVDVGRVAELRGVTTEQAAADLAGLVYPDLNDPATLLPAAGYLSGNVREKLAAAQAAAREDPVYWDNVRALREVMPADVEASQIRVRPGVPWVPTTDVEAFVTDVLRGGSVNVDHLLGRWVIEVPDWQRTSAVMTEEYGTNFRDAVGLLEDLCNSKPIVVQKPIEGGGSELDMQATFAAQAKANKITDRFAEWVFTDDVRRERLVAEYNRRFNSLRAPKHDGTHLTFPGLSAMFTPHPYQRDAVARIINEPTVLLDHVVGAGKTGTMLMGAMELKRLGLVNQPWIVVPNHIIEQFGREAKQWYPAANILMGAAATTAEGRRRLVAQSAASDWDMVIVPQSAFTLIGVSPELKRRYVENSLDKLKEQITDTKSVRSKKMVERAIKAQEARLEQLTEQASKDTGLRFEQTGCDYLFVDEAHMHKNKGRVSNVTELACPQGSMQAEDLAMKLDVLRQRRRDEALAAGSTAPVERVATFATGTPIANSLGELWVMQTFLRPDLLIDAGVDAIDDWGATYTGTTSSIEVNATGTKLRPVTRVGKFVNLPELLQLSSVYSDVVTRDQVPVDLPQLVDGQRQIITTVPDQDVKDFITDLAYRADHLDPKDMARDNNLKISSDGRNVSLDPRLAHLGAPEHGSRAGAVAEQVMRIHDYSKEFTYRDEFGTPSDIPGGLQIVFCDRGTPKSRSRDFTMYQAIRDELLSRGMDPDRIRFIHDAVKPSDKLALQADCRNGLVSVLLGSTEKMGTGTNVQTRAIAEHHVDVPWRPADLEQREGRIIRQGNQNRAVEILNYVTEGSFDTIMWQKVEAKALFVNQAKRNEVDVREVEDLGGGDIGSSAAATKAMATGDPRYLRQVQLDDEVKRFTALAQAHREAQSRNSARQGACEKRIPELERAIAELQPIVDHLRAGGTDQFTYTIGGTDYTERKGAADGFREACRAAYVRGKDLGSSRFQTIATINGIDMLASRSTVNNTLDITLAVPSKVRTLEQSDLFPGQVTQHRRPDGTEVEQPIAESSAAKARGLLQRVENLYKELPDYQAILQHEKVSAETDLDDLRSMGNAPFEHTAELAAKRSELDQLTLQLRMEATSDAAKAEEAAATERMASQGRLPGWSLLLNPTPKVLSDLEAPDADTLRQRVRESQAQAAADYTRNNPTASSTTAAPDNSTTTAAPAHGAAPAPPVIDQAERRRRMNRTGPTRPTPGPRL